MCSAAVAQKRLCLSLAVAAVGLGGGVVKASTFYTGADVSLLTFMQQSGVQFRDNGVAANGDQILYNAGANLFRLRIFVNPQTTYNSSASGAMQTTAYDIALSQQIKADDPAAKILLDFHYSDTWADPGHQTKPSAWTGASTLSALETDVTSYTASTLSSFQSAGVMPDMVQIGNETTSGMLWQTGSSGAAAVGGRILFQGTSYPGLGLTNNKPTQAQTNASFQNFGGLLNAAIAGVRQAQGSGPRIPVVLSVDSGDANGQPQYYYGNIVNPALCNVTDFDIEGVDYYPSTTSGKSYAFLQSNLTTLANTNYSANPTNPKTIMLLETNYPYTGTANAIPMWPATQAGQEQEFLDVRNTILNLPHNDGEGALYWYPEAVQVNPYTIYNGGNTALFNTTANSYGALAALSPTTGAFNVTGTITATWVTNQNADWNTASNWLGDTVPNSVGSEADLLSQISAPRILTSSAAVTLGSLYFNNANAYTLSGSGSLTMQVASGSALVDVISGSHTINVPLTIASSTTIAVASGAGLTIASPVTVNANQTVTPSGSGTISYQSSVTLNSGAGITFANSFHATGLTLSTGSTAVAAAHGSNPKLLVQLDQLTFGNTTDAWQGKLDLNDNDMIVHSGNIANITNQIKEGYGTGIWNGAAGIVSSAAIGTGNKTLGVELNDDGSGNALVTTFDGQTVVNTDVLVKYTYFGDANLDGMVNGSDYTLIDNGYNSGLSGWRNGDFNYDGTIDGDDYVLIDNAFNTQGSPLVVGVGMATTTEQIAGDFGELSRAVPEPGMGIFAIVAMGMVVGGKRRRRVDA